MNPILDTPVSILVIDDEAEVVGNIVDALADSPYLIDAETDPRKALAAMDDRKYDLVLTDLNMPGITGMDLIDTLRSRDWDTEVIVVTGYASLETAIQSIHYGVYDYVQKPFAFADLRSKVSRAVEKQRMRRATVALQRRVERMLSDTSLLVDVSRILYQVTDFQLATDMILDTVTEGMRVHTVALMRREGVGPFEVADERNLSPLWRDSFSFHMDDALNGIAVSRDDLTVVPLDEDGLTIGDRHLAVEGDMAAIYLSPVRFHDRLLGYLAIFPEGRQLTDPEALRTLLGVLSTQIAPVIHSERSEALQSVPEVQIATLVRERLREARALGCSIAFVMMRLVVRDAPEVDALMSEAVPSCKDLMANAIDHEFELVWQTWDTALLVLPGADLFTSERICFDLRQQVEKLEIGNGRPAGLSLKYAVCCYPQQVNGDAAGIISCLWARLLEELEKPADPIETNSDV